MDKLMSEIAANAADCAVERWGKKLPKGRQIRLWNRHFDGVLAALLTFEELRREQILQVRTEISAN